MLMTNIYKTYTNIHFPRFFADTIYLNIKQHQLVNDVISQKYFKYFMSRTNLLNLPLMKFNSFFDILVTDWPVH